MFPRIGPNYKWQPSAPSRAVVPENLCISLLRLRRRKKSSTVTLLLSRSDDDDDDVNDDATIDEAAAVIKLLLPAVRETEHGSGINIVSYVCSALQSGYIGCKTGNGKKLSSSQANLGQAQLGQAT